MKKSIQSMFCLLAVVTLCSTYTTAMPRKKTNEPQATAESKKYADVAERSALSATYTSPAAGGPSTMELSRKLPRKANETDEEYQARLQKLAALEKAAQDESLDTIFITSSVRQADQQIKKDEEERRVRDTAAFVAEENAKKLQRTRKHEADVHAKKALEQDRLNEMNAQQRKAFFAAREAERNPTTKKKRSTKACGKTSTKNRTIEDQIAEELALESAAKESIAAQEEFDRTLLSRPFPPNTAVVQTPDAFDELCTFYEKYNDNTAANRKFIKLLQSYGSINPILDIPGHNTPTRLIYGLVMKKPKEFFNEELFTYLINNMKTEDILNLEYQPAKGYYNKFLPKNPNRLPTIAVDSSLIEAICMYKNKKALALLLEKHPDIQTKLRESIYTRWTRGLFSISPHIDTTLQETAIIAILEWMKEHIRNSEGQPDYLIPAPLESSLLHEALKCDAPTEIINYILVTMPEQKALINKPIEDRTVKNTPVTAPFIAIKNNNISTLIKLKQHDADFTHLLEEGDSLLSYAVQAKRTDIIKYLLEQEEFQRPEMQKSNRYILCYAINVQLDEAIINTILEKLELLGIDINAVNPIGGGTALYYAAKNNDLDLIKKLIEKGANPNEHGHRSEDILSYINRLASQDGKDRSPIYRYLKAHGAEELKIVPSQIRG